MPLQDEIDVHRKEIHTDSYPMSIGELVNLYRDGEIDIHPEFQRFYRWSLQQKSRWIESILLGIPLPSVFVAQRPDGVWDLVDGLQRMSTILEFMGELKDDTGGKKQPLVLDETKFLPSLKNVVWDAEAIGRPLTADQQRYIKRSKFDMKIILRESPEASKYELFQRLNTGGSFLSDQEVRSCILISINRAFYNWVVGLSHYPAFQQCVPLNERQLAEQYDLELVVRFLVLRTVPESELSGIKELGEFVTRRIAELAQQPSFNADVEAKAFQTTFDILSQALESDAFRKYETSRKRFLGAFLISAFEVIALGLGYNFKRFKGDDVVATVKKLVTTTVWSKPDFLTSSGISASQRLPTTIPRGRKVFGQ